MKKKILIVGTQPFIPILHGSTKVVYEYCKLLKSMGHELYYCNQVSTEYDNNFVDFMDGRAFSPDIKHKLSFMERIKNKKRITSIKLHKQDTNYNYVDDLFPQYLGEYVQNLNNKHHFDICIVNYVILSKVLEYIDVPRKVIFTHDAFTNKHELLNLDTFWFSLTPDEEAKGLRRATDILSIQQNESILFRYYNPQARIYTVYSPFSVTKQDITGNNNVLFISGNNILNQNGIDYFLKEIFPLILMERGDVKLIVGGKICEYLKNKDLKNVELRGMVDDIASFYSLGDIAINPIYQGTGLKIKTFEALSFGKATIAHTHSIEGIYDSENAPVLVCDTKEEFAKQIIRVFDDVDLRTQLAKQSIEYIQNMNKHIVHEYERLVDF